ncbi:MAG TPA: biosynthetic peptidoglycan transglycosylase [Bacteroidia bacterium]|nr:biosynthetic peptidoglycan transglycosylase [Bacteroidia bacterium]HNU32607.1 biosynthetic peptidoglycan transglycosylase [Bacteroidia bacterium]
MIKKIFVALVLFFLLAVLGLFMFKDALLKSRVDGFSQNFHECTGGYLAIEKVSFSSFPEFTMQGIVLQDSAKKPVIEIKKVSARIALRKLLQLKAGLAAITIDTLNATFVKDSTGSNYSFINKNKLSKVDNEVKQPEKKLMHLVNSVFEHLADVARFKGELYEFRFKFILNGTATHIHIPYGILNKGVFNMTLYDESFASVLGWSLKGEIADDNKRIDFILEKTGSARNDYFPFFNVSGKPNVGCNKLYASVQNIESSDVATSFTYIAAIDSFKINHWRIADNVVVFDSLRCNLKCRVTGNNFYVDSTSTIELNKIKSVFAFNIDKEKSLKSSLQMVFNTSANDFFGSLPPALFFAFEGMKFKGSVNYNLKFSIDTAQLNNLEFSSALTGKNFGVEKYGTMYFPKINQSFLYDAYDGERFVKSFWIGAENPDFVQLQNISSYLQYAVLTSEDPSFFYHRGFVEESFRESIIENIKERRFVRGGSTISMQLVKNVFLSRQKNISRKLQEALIVWLIENNNICSKERMFEIYLNAIEWGPGIYGIKQAAEFYFAKHPSELSLAESIYLSSIIPRPKYFKYNFDKEGKLKPYLGSYYKLITNRMLSKTWITSFDTLNLQPQVILKGEALKLILPNEPLPPDSVTNSNGIF